MKIAIITLKESMKHLIDPKKDYVYDEREVAAIIDLLLDEVCGISRSFRILHPDHILPPDQRERLNNIAEQLSLGIPVQQALGYEYFHGFKFKVSPDVLIPRPETAELVDWIIADSTASPTILDLGTGSGCIAIVLNKLINNSHVLALDLSTSALAIAKSNATALSAPDLHLLQGDILQLNNPTAFNRLFNSYQQVINRFDIIVSNPPYICNHERSEMSPIVLDHEPHSALFVPDSDPLIFYRAIAEFALSHLTDDGALYFEINAAYGHQTVDLLESMGFKSVTLRSDFAGRDRMIKAQRL